MVAGTELIALREPAGPLQKLMFAFEPLRVRLAQAIVTFLLRNPWIPSFFLSTMALFDLAWGEILYKGEVSSQARMWQNRQRALGDTFASFESVVHGGGAEVFEYIERTPKQLKRLSALVAQRAQPDVLSPHTFLFTEGPIHDRDKEVVKHQILGRLTPADWMAVDALMGKWRPTQPAKLKPEDVGPILIRSIHRLLIGMEADDTVVGLAAGWQKSFFSPLVFVSPFMRRTLLAGAQKRLEGGKRDLMQVYASSPAVKALFPEDKPIDGMSKAEFLELLVEVLNLNGAAILSNSIRMVMVLNERPDLAEKLRAEHEAVGVAGAGPISLRSLAACENTRRFALETMRLYTRVTTVPWESAEPFEVEIGGKKTRFPAGTMRTAVIACANVDPALYPDPYEIKFDRDYSRFVQFGGLKSPRACPGQDTALTMITLLLIHLLRKS